VKTSYSLFLDGFPEDGGKPIDSSKGLFGDKPFEFNVGVSEVIKGWDLSLMDMVEGEARRLVIPPDLGYGDRGAGGRIPGGATLYFEVQLTENGKMPEMNEGQKKWLEEHPL
jgi:FKBP-type peptidyl-prolyl cis-trans isomerase